MPSPAPTRALVVFTQGGKLVGEHRRVEFPGLAVGVAEGAREGGGEQRRAVLGGGGEQLVDEAVLAAPQAERVEPRGGEEVGGVGAPGMRRGENHRDRLVRRTRDHDRGGLQRQGEGDGQVHFPIQAAPRRRVTWQACGSAGVRVRKRVAAADGRVAQR